ncbi:MAG: hypothetical protein ABIC91_00190 [Nanoarchaeota archaeon]
MSKETVWECEVCGDEFDTKKKCLIHEKNHQKKKSNNNKNTVIKYEYLEITLNISGGVPGKKNVELLDEYGQDGWELITVVAPNAPIAFTSVPVTKTLIAYFKRKIN